MKTIFVLLAFALLQIGCAPAGGGSSSGGAAPVVAAPVAPTVHTYTLRVTGTPGTQFAIGLTVNFGEADQVQFNSGNGTLGMGGVDFPLDGRNVLSQMQQNSVGALSFELYKDGVLIETRTTNANGQSHQVTEGL